MLYTCLFLVFEGMSAILLIFWFCLLGIAYLSWKLLDVATSSFWTILLLSLYIQSEYNSSLLLEKELKKDLELTVLGVKVQPFTSLLLSPLLKMILLTTQSSIIFILSRTKAMFELLTVMLLTSCNQVVLIKKEKKMFKWPYVCFKINRSVWYHSFRFFYYLPSWPVTLC